MDWNPIKATAAALVLNLALAIGVSAQSPDEGNQPPEADRGVARLSLATGDVTVQRGDSGEWTAAAMNAPLVVQDRLLTGERSAAEVQFDAANVLRLAQDTEVRMAALDYGRYMMQIGRGTVTYRVLRDGQNADVEISTPTVSLRPVRSGVYRITVQPDGTTEFTVRGGEADVYSPRGSERLRQGQMMVARGNPDDPEFQTMAAPGPDDWDMWNDRRDREVLNAQSYQYVAPDVYGAEDLDRSGQWVNTPDYGYVWTPAVAADWAPYRNGRWVWMDYYGWSWVSYDPWGWAPYHYGRWFYRPATGWCWWPGDRYQRHYWSPALVAFFGFGGGGGIGFGNVGWVPLAPREPLYRWWGRGYYGGYRNTTFLENNVRITNVNITNVYSNARYNGITGVDRTNFGRASITRANLVNVRGGDLERASLVRGPMPIAPARESLRMSDRSFNTNGIRSGNDNGRFYSHRELPKVDRVPFDQQQRGLEQLSRRTFGDRGGMPSSPVPAQAGGSGWGGRGMRGVPSNPGVAASPEPGNRDNGWRRFGDPGPARQDAAAGRSGEAPRDNGMRWGGRQSTPAPEANPNRDAGAGYRRFGDPGPAQPPAGAPAENPERGNRGQWRTFGSGPANSYSERPNAAPAPITAPAPQERGFGRANRGEDRPQYTPAPAPRYNAPQQYAPPPQYNAPQRREYSRPEPVHQAAPEHPAFSGGGRGAAPQSAPPPQSHGGGGGGSAPRNEGGGNHGGGGGGGNHESHGGGNRGR